MRAVRQHLVGIPDIALEGGFDRVDTGTILVFLQIASMVAVVILHQAWITHFAIGTNSGVHMNAAIGLLHRDSKDEALVDAALVRSLEDGFLEEVDFLVGVVWYVECSRATVGFQDLQVVFPPRQESETTPLKLYTHLHCIPRQPLVDARPASTRRPIARVGSVRTCTYKQDRRKRELLVVSAHVPT